VGYPARAEGISPTWGTTITQDTDDSGGSWQDDYLVVALGPVAAGEGRVDDRRGGQNQNQNYVSPGSAVSEDVSDDWYVAAVDEVASAADRLHTSLDCLVEQLAVARGERLAGMDLLDIVGLLVDAGWRDARRAPTTAFRSFEHSLTAYRGCAVRSLVDDLGMSLTSVGRLTGVSRQMVARLYRAANGTAPPRL
jgi:hypothetical protein